MSRKPEESTHNSLFDGIETKLLVFGSKPQIHEGSLNPQCDKLKSTRETFKKNSAILLIIICFAFDG